MKAILINFLLIFLLFNTKSDFPEFEKFVQRKFIPSESVRRNCTWQYAIVKVKIDKNNNVTGYHVENNTSAQLVSDFKYLLGYHFKEKVPIKHDVVFFISLENQRSDACDATPTGMQHEVAQSVYNRYKLQQKKANIKNTYINEILITVIYDPEY